MIDPIEDRRSADHPAARLPRRARRRDRGGRLRDHLLPPVVPAGALRRPVPGHGERQPHPRRAHPGAARRHRRPPGPRCWSTTACRSRSRSSPTSCRRRGRTRDAVFRRLSARARQGHEPAQDRPPDRSSSAVGAALLRRDAEERRRRGRSTSTSSSARTSSRASRRSSSTCATTRARTLAAQLFGTVGEISPTELKESKFRGVKQGTIVGQSGIEYTYDRYLRGRDGAQRIYVDALGRAKARGPEIQPGPGKQMRLSLDLDLEKAGEEAMSRGRRGDHRDARRRQARRVRRARPAQRRGPGDGLLPELRPQRVREAGRRGPVQELNSDAYGAPLYNRAIAGLYPTGSTFKLITATAALQSGLITPSTIIDDGGSVYLRRTHLQGRGRGQRRDQRRDRAEGLLRRLLLHARRAGQRRGRRHHPELGQAPRGSGAGPGIDLPGEFKGLVPTPAWRRPVLRSQRQARRRPPVDDRRQHQPRGRPGRPAGQPAPDGDRLLDDRQRRQGRAPAPRPARRGRRRPAAAGDRAGRRAQREDLTRARATRSSRACARPRASPAVRRPTCSRASAAR